MNMNQAIKEHALMRRDSVPFLSMARQAYWNRIYRWAWWSTLSPSPAAMNVVAIRGAKK